MNKERETRNTEEHMVRDLKERLRDYSLRIVRMYNSLPRNDAVAGVLGHQVLRRGTSVGAHHREAVRARSDAEFISKMEGGAQELEETDYWLDLLVGSEIVPESRMKSLIDETDELMAIVASSVKTVKKRRQKKE